MDIRHISIGGWWRGSPDPSAKTPEPTPASSPASRRGSPGVADLRPMSEQRPPSRESMGPRRHGSPGSMGAQAPPRTNVPSAAGTGSQATPTTTLSATQARPAAGAADALEGTKVPSISLSQLLKRKSKPVGPMIVAEMDLSARARNHLRTTDERGREASLMPQMSLSITIDDPKMLANYDAGKENLALQRMQVKAYEAMNAASRDIERFARDYAAKHGDRPNMSPQDRAQFDKLCRAIVQAQQSRVQQIVQREIEVESRRDSSKFNSDMRFAVKVVLNTTALTAALTSAAATGPTPLNGGMAGWRVNELTKTVRKYGEDREKLAQRVLKNDKKLAEAETVEKQKEPGFGAKVARREIVSALQVPFLKKMASVRAQRQTLEEFDARTVRTRNELGEAYARAEKERANIEEMSRRIDLTPEQREQLQQAGAAHGKLMDSVVEMMQTLESDDKLLRKYSARCDGYENNHPPDVDATAEFVDTALQIRRMAFFANNLQTIIKNVGMLAG